VETQKEKLHQLFNNPTWSEEDRKWLLHYLEQNNSAELQQLMQELFILDIDPEGKSRDQLARIVLQKIHQQIRKRTKPDKKIVLMTWLRYAAAASIIFLLGTGIYNIITNKGFRQTLTSENISAENDLPPGGNKAILTLGNGNQIILDTVSTGMISRQSGTQIVKSGDGQVEYESDNSNVEKIDYNTISTPQGGQYQLTLSDGSRVWLNAASSIRFPAVFRGKERKVFITGEAYFEVNPQFTSDSGKKGKLKNIPFMVDIADKGTVEVLGTHFNINAYADEDAIKTTLLEGSVGFRPITSQNTGKTPEPVIIVPGQQVILSPAGQVQVDSNVNLEKVVAWKNGYFLFTSSSLQEVMTQIARWYDVEVVFEGKISERKFGGKIQRDLNLSETLKILEKNNVRFKIDGRKLYVES
jgi:transmembrane sensor